MINVKNRLLIIINKYNFYLTDIFNYKHDYYMLMELNLKKLTRQRW